MNIFRLAGDMTHLASVLVLLLKIHTIKSCAGMDFTPLAPFFWWNFSLTVLSFEIVALRPIFVLSSLFFVSLYLYALELVDWMFWVFWIYVFEKICSTLMHCIVRSGVETCENDLKFAKVKFLRIVIIVITY